MQCFFIVYPQRSHCVYKNCPQGDSLCKTCQYHVWIIKNMSKFYPQADIGTKMDRTNFLIGCCQEVYFRQQINKVSIVLWIEFLTMKDTMTEKYWKLGIIFRELLTITSGRLYNK